MDKNLYNHYVAILNQELVPAMGCTEPIAIAYASAKAVSVLGQEPESIEVWCSGNIIKNIQGVIVPNSGGLKGIKAAAILGALGGDSTKQLEVLNSVSPDDILRTKELVNTDFCRSFLNKDVDNLYILVKVRGAEHSSEVEILDSHTNITKITKDGVDIFTKEQEQTFDRIEEVKEQLNVRNIFEFADTVDIEDVSDVLKLQIQMNTAISEEGLSRTYGASVGRTLLDTYCGDVSILAKAKAAAGSDARMNGCPLPVIINSGSGNQGIAASIPVIEYAKELGATEEKLYRALVLSNLISLHQKKYIGKLSAYCGAVCAACGSGAAITYLHGGDYTHISNTIINTIATVGGILCDGAKSSCAAKIASAVDAAITGHNMSMNNHVFAFGEGLVQDDVEHTIKNLGYVGCVGMKSTDIEILNIMLNKVPNRNRADV